MANYTLPPEIQSAIADLAYALHQAQSSSMPDHDPAVQAAYNHLTELVRQECDIEWLHAPLTPQEEKACNAVKKPKERKDIVLGMNEEDDLDYIEFLWTQYALADDSELTPLAQQLKKKLLAIVAIKKVDWLDDKDLAP